MIHRWQWRPDWSPELSQEILQWFQLLTKYGFRTDYSEVCYQLALVVKVMTHKLAPTNIDNLLGMTIEAELRVMPYSQRRKKLRRLIVIYAKAKAFKKEYRERQAARHPGSGKTGKASTKSRLSKNKNVRSHSS